MGFPTTHESIDHGNFRHRNIFFFLVQQLMTFTIINAHQIIINFPRNQLNKIHEYIYCIFFFLLKIYLY